MSDHARQFKGYKSRTVVALVGALLLLGSMGTARAATYTFTGNASWALESNGSCTNGHPGDGRDWNNPKNWGPPCLPAGPPGGGDTAIINGSNVILAGTAITVANLQINQGGINFAMPNAADSLIVTGTFDFAGQATLTGLTLGLPPTAIFNYTATDNSGFSNVTINNYGTFNYNTAGLNVYWYSPGAFNNKLGATFNDASTANNRLGGGQTGPYAFTFNNEGTFRKTGSGNMEWSAGAFNNSGTVDIQVGTLDIPTGGLHSGTLNIAATAAINLRNNGVAGFSFAPTSLITGAGEVRTYMQGSANSISGTITMDLGGTLVVPLNATLVTTAAGVTLVTRNGGLVRCDSGSYINGTIELAAGSRMDMSKFVIGGTLNNRGTVYWTGDSNADIGIGTSNSVFNNLAGGILNAASGGVLGVPFANAGTVNMGTPTAPGIFKVSNYTQTASGVLNAKIGGTVAGTQFDQLMPVGSTATLDGTLNISLINGFAPASNQTFPIVSSNGGPVSGRFATINNPFTAQYKNTSANVTLRSLNIDGDGTYDALTDGVIILRYLLGLTGSALTNGAVGSGATRGVAADIVPYLDSIRVNLDVDGNGQADARTDGLMILRYLFGFRGAALFSNDAIGSGATRTPAQTESYIKALMP